MNLILGPDVLSSWSTSPITCFGDVWGNWNLQSENSDITKGEMCWVLNPPMPPTKCNLSDRQMVGELTIGMALITQIGKEVGFNTKYCQVLAHTHRKPRPAASLRYTKNYFPLFLSPFATPGEREPNLILFWKWSPVSCWMSHQRQAAHIPSTRPKMLPRFFSIFNSCRNQKKNQLPHPSTTGALDFATKRTVRHQNTDEYVAPRIGPHFGWSLNQTWVSHGVVMVILPTYRDTGKWVYKPYHWVDDRPYDGENNGSLDPGTYRDTVDGSEIRRSALGMYKAL